MHDMWDKFTLQAGQRITLQANWHADVLHSIEKIICFFVCMCFLFLFFFFVGWWEGEVLLCCERSEGFVFQGCFPQLLSCCFILKMMRLLFFWIFSTFLSFFFFRAGLFLLLNCCLAYFLRCGIMKCTSACCCFKGPPVFCCRVRRSGRDPSFPFQESWNALVFTFFVISSAWLFLTVNDTLHNWDALRERGT